MTNDQQARNQRSAQIDISVSYPVGERDKCAEAIDACRRAARGILECTREEDPDFNFSFSFVEDPGEK